MSKKLNALCLAGLLTAVMVMCAVGQAAVAAGAPRASSGLGAAEAATYIRTNQNADGGFSEPDAASDTMTTCWALIAGASAGELPLTWTKGGATPQQYLSGAVGSTSALREFEMMTIALEEAGADTSSVSGRDLVSLIKASIAGDGKIGADVSEHCWGMLALATVGETMPANCGQWLLEQQREDGGWGETDQVIITDTAMAVQALAASEEQSADAISSALDLLRSSINSDGGFKGTSAASDAQATAAVIEAINAGGEDPTSAEWSFQGNTPMAFLNSLQAGDGHFKYSTGVESQPVMTSAMAAPATSGDYFPLAAANAASSDDSSQASGDLGTAGAGISSGGSAQSTVGAGQGPNLAVRVLRGSTSGAEGSATGAAGLWLFLIACVIYSVLLLVLVLLVSRLVAGSRHAPPPIAAGAIQRPGA